MRLERLSIDDLHQCAITEMEDDPHVAELLHDVYVDLRGQYVVIFEALRAVQEYPA